ncbi:MAG TPA: tetratricopeptide repeat protein, partial [Candidatus Brocadiaceae bacterium]
DLFIIGLLFATVVIIPLFFDIRLYSVFDLSKVTALYLLTIAILLIWSIIIAGKHDFKFSRTPLDMPILAYISVFIISSILSINPLMSLLGTYKRFEGLTATLCYILLFYSTVNFVTTQKRFYVFLISIIAASVLASFYGIAQHLGFDIFKWSSFEARRVFSTFGNPVFFSSYLIMTLPLAVVLFLSKYPSQEETPLSKSPRSLWIFFIVSLVIYNAFWLTNTRACFVALLGGLAPLLFFISKKHTTERYKFVVLVISFILIGVFFNVRHETSVIRHFDEASFNEGVNGLPVFEKAVVQQRPWIANKLSVKGSSFSRIFQYLAAIEIIKDHPILGIGPDTIGIIYQKYLAKVFSLVESDKGFPFPRQDRIHNDILDTMVTRGIFGLGTYVWLLTAFGVYVTKNYKQLSNQNKLLILGLITGITCYLIQNEFSFGNTPIVMLFWVMMGLCVSVIKIGEREEVLRAKEKVSEIGGGCEDRELGSLGIGKFEYSQLRTFSPSHPRIFHRWLSCGIVIVTIGFVALYILRLYKADVYFEYGRRVLLYNRENLNTTAEKGLYFIEHAALLNPCETFYHDELCRTYIQMASRTKDESWLQKAHIEADNSLKLIPQHFMGFFNLGIIYQMLAEHFNKDTRDEAIAYYKKAIEADPFQAPFHNNLASLYINKGNWDQAIEELCQAYLIQPKDLNHVGRLANAYLQKGDLEKAIFFSRKAIELNPADPGNYNNLGAVLSKKGMYEEAINSFIKALEIKPKEAVYLDNLTKLYLVLEKYDELISYYKKLITINPSVADYHNNLGVAYKREKHLENAIQSFQNALTLKPDNSMYTINLVNALIDQGRHSDAKQILQAFNNAYPNHNDKNIHLLLANLYSGNADWEKVALECEQTIKMDKKSAAAYKMLGIAYYNMHKYELAEKMLHQTLALDSNDPEAKDLLVKISSQ